MMALWEVGGRERSRGETLLLERRRGESER